MKNRVKVLETKFYVNEEKRTVVCKVTCDMQVEKSAAYLALAGAIPLIKELTVFTVEGKAKCNTADTFNEKIGKMIAEGRAKAKMLSAASRAWNYCATMFSDMVSECTCLKEACDAAQSAETKHVIELSK